MSPCPVFQRPIFNSKGSLTGAFFHLTARVLSA